MNILTISLRNTRRKWVKTLLLLLVFTLGVTSIISLNYVSNVVGDSLEKKLLAYGANILIMPKSEKLTVSYGGFSMGDMALGVKDLNEVEVRKKIKSIEEADRIPIIAPKLVAMTTVGDTSVGIVGVRWNMETQLKGYWVLDGVIPTGGNEVVVGSKVAERLNLKTGDAFKLGEAEAMVSAVLQPTGSDDDSVVFTSMRFAQVNFGKKGRVSFVEVAAHCAGCPIEEITQQLEEVMPNAEIQALQSIVKQRMYSVNFVKQLILTVSVIILFIACCMVGVTMLSSVNERIKEIGLMRSLGFSRPGIFAIFCFEALLIGVLAGAIGYVAGVLLSIEVLGMLDMAEDATLSFDAAHLFLTCLFIASVSMAAAFFPAWKASNVEPSEALISL